jgi:hypothetical protein
MSDIAQSLRALAERTAKNETPRSGDSSERGMSDIAQGLRALASERGMSDIAQGLRALAEKTAKNETPRSGDSSERGMSADRTLEDICKEIGATTQSTEMGTAFILTDDHMHLIIDAIKERQQSGLISAERSQSLIGFMEAGLMRGGPLPLYVREPNKRTDASQTVLSLTEAKLAKKLGYELCLCTFPPSVMLWRETKKASVCPSCGRQSKTKQSKRK